MSNITPKAVFEKIKSAPKSRIIRTAAAACIVGVALIFALTPAYDRLQCGVYLLLEEPRQDAELQVDNTKISLEVADSAAERSKGLSYRACMPRRHGMLFAYTQTGNYQYWMKSMHFPLDMVFLDADKKIIAIHQHVAPESYPDSYGSESPSQYMIELNGGVVSELGLRLGQELTWK